MTKETLKVLEFPSVKFTLMGFTQGTWVNLADFHVTDMSKKEESFEAILSPLLDTEKVVFGSTIIFTEAFSAFRIVDNGTNQKETVH
jgi:hypothetical protein